jgi:hypothetical protein
MGTDEKAFMNQNLTRQCLATLNIQHKTVEVFLVLCIFGQRGKTLGRVVIESAEFVSKRSTQFHMRVELQWSNNSAQQNVSF